MPRATLGVPSRLVNTDLLFPMIFTGIIELCLPGEDYVYYHAMDFNKWPLYEKISVFMMFIVIFFGNNYQYNTIQC